MKAIVAFFVVLFATFATAAQEDPDVVNGIRGAPCRQPPKMLLTMSLVEETCQANTNRHKPAACGFTGKLMFPGDIVMICMAMGVQESCMKPWQVLWLKCVPPPVQGVEVLK